MIKSTIETIDPAKAQEYLEKVHHQRRVTKGHVEKLSRSMSAGHWRMTGEPIQFDREGHLINGQHRMRALIAANATLQFIVVRGLEHSAYEVMDQGRARTKGETVATLGMKNAQNAAASAQILVRMKYGLEIDRTQVDNAEVIDFAKRNYAVLEEASTQAKRFRELPGSTYGAALFLALHAAHDRALEFADLLHSGAGLEHNSPVLALRNKALAIKRSRNRLEEGRTSRLLPLIIRAFDAFVDDQPLTKIIATEGQYYPRLLNMERFWDDK